MATKRVIAYVFHEEELRVARIAMPQGEVTDGFVVGDADEADIERPRPRRAGRLGGRG